MGCCRSISCSPKTTFLELHPTFLSNQNHQNLKTNTVYCCTMYVVLSFQSAQTSPSCHRCLYTAWLNGMNLIFKGDGMLSQHRLLTKDNFHEYDYKAHTPLPIFCQTKIPYLVKYVLVHRHSSSLAKNMYSCFKMPCLSFYN